ETCESTAVGRHGGWQRATKGRAQEDGDGSDGYGGAHRHQLGDDELLEVDAPEKEDRGEKRQGYKDEEQHEGDRGHQLAPTDAERGHATDQEHVEGLPPS